MRTPDALSRLTAGLARRERIAQAATELPVVTPRYPAKKPPWEPERWRLDQYGQVVTVNGATDPITDADYGGGGTRSRAVAEFIAANDPADALRQVAAIREVIADYELHSDAKYPDFEGGYASALEDVIGALAGIYTEPTEEKS